jgi:hypothetical protein
MAAETSDGRGGRAGIENDDLAGANHAHGSGSDACLFLTMKPLLFLKGLVLECARAKRKRAAVGAL